MKKQIVLCGMLMVAVLSISLFAGAASATTTNTTLNGKGAVAQWTMAGHVINAYVVMSDSGKDGTIYVSIQHPRGISAATGDVEFKWSMDHVIAEVTDLNFQLTGDTASGFTGSHNVTMTWDTVGNTNQNPLDISTGYGLTGTILGQWKTGTAALELDPTATTGHHQDSTYQSTWAAVFKGTTNLAITLPTTPPA
jgi:hypothetical protein